MCPKQPIVSRRLPRPDDLDVARARRRRDRLVATRRVLAETAAQQRSHGLDEAEETYQLQLQVEQTLRDEFPATYEALLPQWLEGDASLAHTTGELTAACAICRAIAHNHGLNLMPPEAA